MTKPPVPPLNDGALNTITLSEILLLGVGFLLTLLVAGFLVFFVARKQVKDQ